MGKSLIKPDHIQNADTDLEKRRKKILETIKHCWNRVEELLPKAYLWGVYCCYYKQESGIVQTPVYLFIDHNTLSQIDKENYSGIRDLGDDTAFDIFTATAKYLATILQPTDNFALIYVGIFAHDQYGPAAENIIWYKSINFRAK
jgi:hypothetical protein